jgi:hypothetical protein
MEAATWLIKFALFIGVVFLLFSAMHNSTSTRVTKYAPPLEQPK